MPHIKFTDSTLKTLSADKTTWFTDPTCRGLRLCVTKGGSKTWYVNKWDPTSNKTRSVKLAQWASTCPQPASTPIRVVTKLHDDLCDQGEVCCLKRVARLARLAGVRAQIGYKRRPGKYGGKPSVVVDNALNR